MFFPGDGHIGLAIFGYRFQLMQSMTWMLVVFGVFNHTHAISIHGLFVNVYVLDGEVQGASRHCRNQVRCRVTDNTIAGGWHIMNVQSRCAS